MKKLWFTIVIILNFFRIVGAQNYSLSGTTISEENAPLGYVDVFLTANDSDVFGTVSDSLGRYTILAPAGQYLLQARTWGYDSTVQSISLIGDMELAPIQLTISSDITEVLILAKKSLITREVDRTRISVEGRILAEGDLWEMLRMAPGIMVTQQGDLKMYGKSGIVVMIDGIPINLSGSDLMDVLSSMSAADVSSIEIISNPPANFAASGSGVINIISKKSPLEGFNGNLRSRYVQGLNSRFKEGASGTWKRKKLYLNGSYDFSHGNQFKAELSDIRYCNSDEVCTIWKESAGLSSRSQSHAYHLYADYAVDTGARISFRTEGSISPQRNVVNQAVTNIYNSDEVLDSSIVNLNTVLGSSNYQSYFLGFQKEFGAGLWSIQADYATFDNTSAQAVGSEFRNPNGSLFRREDFKYDARQKVNIAGSQFDLSVSLNDFGSLDAGLKFSNINTQNDLNHFDLVNDRFVWTDSRSNEFNYHETNAATYFSWRKNWEKLRLKFGLRGEYTDLQGKDKSGEATLDTDYLRLFPSAYFQYIASEKNVWGLTFGQRINRPLYRHLNAFRQYSSPYSYIEGNPFLQPAISRNLELSFIRSSNYYFSAFVQHVQNPMTQLSIQDNESSTIRYYAVNLDEKIQAGVSANGTVDFTSWWSVYWDVSAYYQRYDFAAPDAGTPVKNEGVIFSPFLWTGFTISKLDNLSLELQCTYNSPGIQGGFRVESLSEVALGLKKKFFDKRLSVAFLWADLFDDNKYVLRSRYSFQDHVYREDPENQYVRLSLTWNFGNQKVKAKEEKDLNTEEKQRL